MTRHPASYRDPAGFVFTQNGEVFRAVMPAYRPHYEWAERSGFFAQNIAAGKLLPFEILEGNELYPQAWRILKPQQISRWTYPTEWSFEQLKAAALLTLELTASALQKGGILKDASPQNIQFVEGHPVLIDTLSVEEHEEGAQWTAFRQFCNSFLYPLLLAHYLPSFELKMLAAFPNGFSATQTAEMLPSKARWNLSNRLYVYLPASLDRKKKDDSSTTNVRKISTASILRNIAHLQNRISILQPAYGKTTWSDYYEETILSAEYLREKETLVGRWLKETRPASVLDLGCNTGAFSLLAAEDKSCTVTATDADAACIDRLFLQVQKTGIKNLNCLITDLTNPLSGGGWAGAGWTPWMERMNGHDAVFALALVHHLALAYNVSLPQIAEIINTLSTHFAVVEWIPKTDPKAQLLLQHRKDVFDHYTQKDFEAVFGSFFQIRQKEKVKGSERVMYVLEKR